MAISRPPKLICTTLSRPCYQRRRVRLESRPMATGKRQDRAVEQVLGQGAKAPKFDLEADSGKHVTLGDFAGKWLVLYFYPRDSTPGCTREAQDFTKAAARFKKLGAQVVGVSKDSVKSHCGFKDKIGIGFPLLSDPD